MKSISFRVVSDPESTKRWVIEDENVRVWCRIIEFEDSIHWQSWVEEIDGRLGQIISNKSDDEASAEIACKSAATELLTEELYSRDRFNWTAQSELFPETSVRNNKTLGDVYKLKKKK